MEIPIYMLPIVPNINEYFDTIIDFIAFGGFMRRFIVIISADFAEILLKISAKSVIIITNENLYLAKQKFPEFYI